MEAWATTAHAVLVFWGKQEISDLSDVNSELLSRAKFHLKGKEQQEWSLCLVISYLVLHHPLTSVPEGQKETSDCCINDLHNRLFRLLIWPVEDWVSFVPLLPNSEWLERKTFALNLWELEPMALSLPKWALNPKNLPEKNAKLDLNFSLYIFFLVFSLANCAIAFGVSYTSIDLIIKTLKKPKNNNNLCQTLAKCSLWFFFLAFLILSLASFQASSSTCWERKLFCHPYLLLWAAGKIGIMCKQFKTALLRALSPNSVCKSNCST